MGKGKGKLSIWSIGLKTGHLLIEFKNLRIGRALYYIRQSQFKLKSSLKVVRSTPSNKVITSFFGQHRVHFQSFW